MLPFETVSPLPHNAVVVIVIVSLQGSDGRC